jgi:hypothetical protein
MHKALQHVTGKSTYVNPYGACVPCRDKAPDTPHPFLDNPASAPLGWGLNTGHYDVRLTGQDCERGTFGQRHAVLWDQTTGGCCADTECHMLPTASAHFSHWRCTPNVCWQCCLLLSSSPAVF